MRQAKFETFQDTNGEWRFNLVAPNGEIIAVSEGYSSKQAMQKGIKAVRFAAPYAKITERQE